LKNVAGTKEGKAILVQTQTGYEGIRRFILSDIKTFSTWRW
jgi:hypothetical protein